MTLKDIFNDNKSYIIEINIPDSNFILFIEGLTENGETINEMFKLNNIKQLCIELLQVKNGIAEYYETIDSAGITINEKVSDIIEKTTNLIGELNE